MVACTSCPWNWYEVYFYVLFLTLRRCDEHNITFMYGALKLETTIKCKAWSPVLCLRFLKYHEIFIGLIFAIYWYRSPGYLYILNIDLIRNLLVFQFPVFDLQCTGLGGMNKAGGLLNLVYHNGNMEMCSVIVIECAFVGWVCNPRNVRVKLL